MSSLRIIEVLRADFKWAKCLRHTHTAQQLLFVVALLLIICSAHAMPLSATLSQPQLTFSSSQVVVG